MIRFLKRVRKSLLFERNFTKYFKYALGEILLVMVGILLALQVNNWNESRKIHAAEIKILKELQSELENDLQSYKSSIRRLETRNNFSNEVLQLLNLKQPKEIDSIEIVRKFLTIGFVENYNPSFSTFLEIQGSGKLSIIKSTQLKRKLAEYKSANENFKTIELNWNEDVKNYERLISYYFKGNIKQQFLMHPAPAENKNLKFDLKEIKSDIELMKLLKYTSYFTQMQINTKKAVIIPIIKELLETIEIELKYN